MDLFFLFLFFSLIPLQCTPDRDLKTYNNFLLCGNAEGETICWQQFIDESVGSSMCAHTPRPIRPFTPMVFIDRSIHTRRRAHKEHLNACICIFVMYITHKNWKSLYSRYSSSRHPRPSQFANNRDVYIM